MSSSAALSWLVLRLQAAQVLNSNAQVWNMLGRCQVSSGDVTDGIHSYQRSLHIQDSSREAWFNLAQASKEVGLCHHGVCCCYICKLACWGLPALSRSSWAGGGSQWSCMGMSAAPSHQLLQLLLGCGCCPTCQLGHKGSLVFVPTAAAPAGDVSRPVKKNAGCVSPATQFSSRFERGLLRDSLTRCLPASHWQTLYSPRLIRHGGCPQPCCCLRKWRLTCCRSGTWQRLRLPFPGV